MDGLIEFVNSVQRLLGLYLAIALWVWIFVSYCLQLVHRVPEEALPREFPPNHAKLFGLMLGINSTVVLYLFLIIQDPERFVIDDRVSLGIILALASVVLAIVWALLLGMIAEVLQN
jgi:hypothetical protein